MLPRAIVLLLVALTLPAWGDPLVKVRLRRALETVDIQAMGLRLSARPSSSQYVRVAIPHLEAISIKYLKSKKPGIPRWQITYAKSKKVEETHALPLQIRGDVMRLGLEPVPRHLKLFPREDGRIDVITELKVDSYLAGVVPSEMPASWPLEAIKAQVIASRSYMYSTMQERQQDHYHLEASIFDQVYSMVNHLAANRQYQKVVRRAINETKGLVLVAPKGEVLRSYYHSDCGGQTEEPDRVWGSGETLGTVKDPSCPLSPHGLWSYKIGRSKLGNRLRTYLGWPKEDKFLSLEVVSRSPSQRVNDVRVIFAGGVAKMSSQDLRRVLGFTRIKSTNFRFHWKGGELTIHGRGNGHGVGMCQWGARTLAKRGLSYERILLHYYGRSRIAPLAEIGGWSSKELSKKQKNGEKALAL